MIYAIVEDKRKNFRLQSALLDGIQCVEKGVVGVETLLKCRKFTK